MSIGNYHRTTRRNAAFVGAAWLAIALVIAAVLNPRSAAAGWLVGFAFWAQILLGSLTLLLIHRLTGGRWGVIIAPAILPAVAAVPALLLLAIPLFVGIPLLYPWAHQAGAIKPDVLSYYLNTPSFLVRSVLALGGWSALALFLPRITGARSQLIAALGLVFHAIVTGSISIDWLLSLEAPFTSSSFGAGIAISALVGALAWAAVVSPMPEPDRGIGDVGGLLLATILGITYVDFVAVLVIWYGDLPREEIWFVERSTALWMALAVAAFLLVSLFPVLALLLSRVRNHRAPLRAVGICVLVGLALYNAYFIAPAVGALALLTSLLALIGIGLGLLGLFASGVTDPVYAREQLHAR